MKLDVKDKKILACLDMDARQALSAIAKQVALSKDSVNYRIRQLEKRDIIQGYYAIIDLTKTGYIFFRISLKFHNASPQKEKEIMEYIMGHPKIQWVVTMHGEWDTIFAVFAKDVTEFESVHDELMFRYGSVILEDTVSIATRIYHFKHNYLYETTDHTQTIMGGQGSAKIDETDSKILALLSENGRMQTVDIGKALGMTANAIKYRIKKLIKDGVILGFRAKLNTAALGYEHYKVLLTLQNLSQESMQKLIAYLHHDPHVIYITKAIGVADLEFEIMVKNQNALYLFMKRFRFDFAEVLRDYKTLLMHEEPLVGYLPK